MLKLPYERQKIEDDMLPMQVAPGILSVLADNEAQGRWKLGNLVRFAPSSGLAQKVGGWVDITPYASLAQAGFIGAVRNTHDWQSLDGQQWTAIGTNSHLYIFNQGITYDITPIRQTDTLTDPFTTTNTSNIITVVDADNGAQVGDYVIFTGFTNFDGITLNGEYIIATIVDPNTYTIVAAQTSTGAHTAGGTGTAQYLVASMAASAALEYGWGTGSWGAGTWGTPRDGLPHSGTSSPYSQVSNIYSQIGIWSLQNWGEDLIASPRGGSIYIWTHNSGPGARAMLIDPTAPLYNERVIVATEQRQIICFGTSTLNADNQATGPLDPSYIAWCAAEDYTTWFPAVTNNAGDLRLNSGSGIIAITKTRGGYFVATTDNCNFFSPTGDVNVYSSQGLGQSTRAMGPNAAVDFNGISYMMAVDNFLMYNGTLSVMPCDVWNTVFGSPETGTNLNLAQSEKCFAFVNRTFSEIWWVYPSVNSTDGENDSYVSYNFLLSCWHTGVWSGNAGGDINRSCGHDVSDQFFAPYMFYYNATTNLSLFFQHETGNLANGYSAFGEFIESWDVDVMQSGQLVNVHHMVPNFKGTLISTNTLGPFVFTAAGASNGTVTIYTGTVAGGGSNAYAGLTFVVTGFADSTDNGTFLCTASTITTLTLANEVANGETHAGAASVTPGTVPGTVQVEVKIRKYPVDAYKIKGPYTVTGTTQKVSARGKGRQIAVRVFSSAPGPGSVNAGIPWTMGTWRTQTGEDGDR